MASPTLIIRPDFANQNYGTGDTVTGQVMLLNAKPELIGRVFIELWGRTKTKIIRRNGNSRVTYRGRHHLFSKVEVIQQTSTPLEAGHTYGFPFSVTFPTTLPPMADGSDQGLDKTLPPSFRDDEMEWGAHFESFVEYKLTANICRHQSNIVMRTTELALNYVPTLRNDQVVPDGRSTSSSQKFIARSLLLLPENEGRELTFKEKTKSVFSSSKLPAAAFKFTVSYPTTVLAGDRFLISAGIEHLPGESTAPTPAVELQSIYISLKGWTNVQAEGVFHNPQDNLEATLWKKQWINVGLFNKGEGWTKMLSTALPELLPPTFKTFNMGRSYCFKPRLGGHIYWFYQEEDRESFRNPFQRLPQV
ncbi:hypothetical protein NA57DRAFT_78096 [Rhizodiscina lignyota]|uniref:Arrestin-like N-terminal domain-containing protein n=1 Tax=Rhizodiscina lignyota TaxID=1504668 RepID=A0A9P4M455_9PEZI|nr:hypothetical protein NA57DRAFT_78096 [Rhizodiscina lignyota]